VQWPTQQRPALEGVRFRDTSNDARVHGDGEASTAPSKDGDLWVNGGGRYSITALTSNLYIAAN